MVRVLGAMQIGTRILVDCLGWAHMVQWLTAPRSAKGFGRWMKCNTPVSHANSDATKRQPNASTFPPSSSPVVGCPGREVPYCPGPCSSQGLSPDKPCAGAEGVTCQLPDGRQWVCNGLSMVTCAVPAMAAPACPVACFETYNYPIPLDSLGATSSDAAIIGAGIDASDEPNRGADDADANVVPDTAEDRSANDAHDDP